MGKVISLAAFKEGRRIKDIAANTGERNAAIIKLEQVYVSLARAKSQNLKPIELIEQVAKARDNMRSDLGMALRDDNRYAKHLNGKSLEELVNMWARFMFRSKQEIRGKMLFVSEMTRGELRDKELELVLAIESASRHGRRSGMELDGFDSAFPNA